MHSFAFQHFRTDGGVLRTFFSHFVLSSPSSIWFAHLSTVCLDKPVVTYLSITQAEDEWDRSLTFQVDIYLSRLVAQELFSTSLIISSVVVGLSILLLLHY